MTFLELAREYLPDLTDTELDAVLWSLTGFPAFWKGEPETALRKQLQEIKDKLAAGISISQQISDAEKAMEEAMELYDEKG